MKKTKRDDSIKILVVFYSKDGHTKRAAEIIANTMNADVDNLLVRGSSPYGPTFYF